MGCYSWSVRVRCPVLISLAEQGAFYQRAEEGKREGVEEGVQLGKQFVAIVGYRNERDPVRLRSGHDMWYKKRYNRYTTLELTGVGDWSSPVVDGAGNGFLHDFK